MENLKEMYVEECIGIDNPVAIKMQKKCNLMCSGLIIKVMLQSWAHPVYWVQNRHYSKVMNRNLEIKNNN